MFHWYLVYRLLSLFGRNRPQRVVKKSYLTNRHTFLQSKSIFFALMFIVIFTGGFLFNYYVASDEKKISTNKMVKQYFSKVTLITLFLILNFFMNEIHLFAYRVSDVYHHIPNNPNFYIFLITVIILMFGLLVLNSKFVPSNFHLNYKFYDTSGKGGKVGVLLLAITGFYAFMNMCMNYHSLISYLVLFAFSTVSLVLNKKVVNVWIIYGILSLFMLNDMQYVINIKIGSGWIILHYFIYALQIAMFLFSLIKLDNFNFFESK